MTKVIEIKGLKRGNNAAVAGYTGPKGELVVNLDTKKIHIQNGITQGGIAK